MMENERMWKTKEKWADDFRRRVCNSQAIIVEADWLGMTVAMRDRVRYTQSC